MEFLIDGYNMIGAWPEFRTSPDISHSREKLVEMLADFAGFTGSRVTVVFDGYKGDKKQTSIEEVAGVTVVYTRRNETADHYIERTVDERMRVLPRYGAAAIRVATSDATEQSVIFLRGAIRVPAKEMRLLLRQAKGEQSARPAARKKQGVLTFEDRLSPEVREKLEKLRRE